MSEERMEELIEYEFLLYDTVFFQFLWFFLARRGKGWEVKDNTHEIRLIKNVLFRSYYIGFRTY